MELVGCVVEGYMKGAVGDKMVVWRVGRDIAVEALRRLVSLATQFSFLRDFLLALEWGERSNEWDNEWDLHSGFV